MKELSCKKARVSLEKKQWKEERRPRMVRRKRVGRTAKDSRFDVVVVNGLVWGLHHRRVEVSVERVAKQNLEIGDGC